MKLSATDGPGLKASQQSQCCGSCVCVYHVIYIPSCIHEPSDQPIKRPGPPGEPVVGEDGVRGPVVPLVMPHLEVHPVLPRQPRGAGCGTQLNRRVCARAWKSPIHGRGFQPTIGESKSAKICGRIRLRLCGGVWGRASRS